jgi:hypothetical protein
LSRLEKMSGDADMEDFHEFFRCMREHGDDPEVGAAVDNIWERMQVAEAALGHPITLREWLNDAWMESWGLTEANNRLFRAAHAAVVQAAESRGGDK